MRSKLRSLPWKSGIRVSSVVVGFIRRMALTVSPQMIEPPSFKSSLSTEVITACLIFISLIERATFSGSSQSTVSGRPVFTPQKPQERVQTLPKIMNVAVPSPQHSPILGQLPEVQMVWRSYLSTNPRNSVYFFPVGSFTLNHLGFLVRGCALISVDIIHSFGTNIQTYTARNRKPIAKRTRKIKPRILRKISPLPGWSSLGI